jgi:hypothetical protein
MFVSLLSEKQIDWEKNVHIKRKFCCMNVWGKAFWQEGIRQMLKLFVFEHRSWNSLCLNIDIFAVYRYISNILP